MRPVKEQGFTLLEIMVAIAIFALAAGAYLKVLGSGARTLEATEERLLAQWSAHNQLTLALLDPAVTGSGGALHQGGHRFRWQLVRRPTDDPRIQRLEVQIRRDDNTQPSLARLTGFSDGH